MMREKATMNELFPSGNEPDTLKDIWHTAFGDEKAVIDKFFEDVFEPSQTLVRRVNSQIVSALYLLPCKIKALQKTYTSFYIYAAATLSAYRGQGYMGELLSAAKEYAGQNGTDFLCLYPAREELYDYYSKHGYKKIFKHKQIRISGSNAGLLAGGDYEIKELSTEDFYRIRGQALANTDFLSWDKKILGFQLYLINNDGGKAYAAYRDGKPAAYALLEKDNTLKEALSLDGSPSPLMSILIQKLGNDEYTLSLPLAFPFSADNMEIFASGMALPVSKKAKIIQKDLNKLYMGVNLE